VCHCFFSHKSGETVMAQRRKSKKRPCRICRKWFSPNPRVGDRQKTCGSDECQAKWHAKKCAEWNAKHASYFTEISLSKKLVNVEGGKSPSTHLKSSRLPRSLIQEVIGAQHLVIIEYMTQLLTKSFQEEIRGQLFEITCKLEQLPNMTLSRGDSSQRGP